MELKKHIDLALEEDMPQGDATTDHLGLVSHQGKCKLVAKQDLILSGKDIFSAVFKRLDPHCDVQWQYMDGDRILTGQIVAIISGDQLQALRAERTALNFLGHLSGIATMTGEFVKRTEGTQAKILDTRKTTPGWRALEKQAVSDGGGVNHRMNLSDGVMIKENHICLMGGLREAVEAVRKNHNGPITVEAANLADVKLAVELQVKRVLLDNMSTHEIKQALQHIPKSIEVEASGNMTLDRIADVAQAGVHFISVGALTHSAPCADFSLLFDWKKGFVSETN